MFKPQINQLFILSFFLLISCQNDDLDLHEESLSPSSENSINGRKKIANPYTIQNINKALKKIRSKISDSKIKVSNTIGKSSNQFHIEPNQLYIKFTPKTAEEEYQLKKNASLALIDYPLGYEYDESFFKNRPALKEGEIPVYYTTITPDKELPEGISYEVLEEMYIPYLDPAYTEDAENHRTKSSEINNRIDFINQLTSQAFEQLGIKELDGITIAENTNNAEQKFLGIRFGSKWTPEGTIRIWDRNIGETTTSSRVFSHYEWYNCGGAGGDDGRGNYFIIAPEEGVFIKANQLSALIGRNDGRCKRAIYKTQTSTASGSYVPLEGAQILLRDTFTIGNEITNNDGYFRFDRKRGNLRYIIQWERYQYSIRDGKLFQAELRGPKQNRRWDRNIKGGEQEYFGHIHRGAHFYYYGNIGGLQRPPDNFTSRQTKIAAVDKCCDGVNVYYLPYLTSGIWPTITIKEYRAIPSQIFATTVHEIAHSTHAASAPLIFPIAEKRMRETYANTIEWFLTTRYFSSRIDGFEHKGNFQNRTPHGDPVYTSFFVDLIDDVNQPAIIDRVSGYSINQIEYNVFRNATFSGLKDDLKKRYNNPTEQFLDELRNNW